MSIAGHKLSVSSGFEYIGWYRHDEFPASIQDTPKPGEDVPKFVDHVASKPDDLFCSDPGIISPEGFHPNVRLGKEGQFATRSPAARGGVREDFKLNDETCYAEVRHGAFGGKSCLTTHILYPVYVDGHSSNRTRSSLIGPRNISQALLHLPPQSYLGARLTIGHFNEIAKSPRGTQAPFLFKILSIAKALQLKAHPDNTLAEQLHKDQFVDDNHKPEIAVAIKNGTCGPVGFKEPEFLVQTLKIVPELIDDDDVISRFIQEKSKGSLKATFSALFTAKVDLTKRYVGRLVERIDRQGADAVGGEESAADLVRTLNERYPFDISVLAAPFFRISLR